ncbi:hypothetical protein PIB30_076534 [Stylosanthes scabra]|uniref:Uncharacterized protein n=1 Tax=Stylosanthes scabra TaxID=79078 RepID=A0ABU6YR17_9FABA|nr:hypothetical protein [Stylosanthes scabra]
MEKLEQTMVLQQREITEIKKQLKEWTRHPSLRDAYCCWAHQQANPNLTEIPIHQIPEIIHANAEKERVKAQRALQFEQEEANSDGGASEKFSEEEIVEENCEEEIQDNMADNANNQGRTLADYTYPTTASCGSSIV